LVYILGKYVTVSTKIPEELKRRMIKLGIKPSSFLRKAIEEEVKKREIRRVEEQIRRLRHVLEKISVEDVVRSVREDRDVR